MADRRRTGQAVLAIHFSLLFAWFHTAHAYGELAFRMLTGANVCYILDPTLFSRLRNFSHDQTTVCKQPSGLKFARVCLLHGQICSGAAMEDC